MQNACSDWPIPKLNLTFTKRFLCLDSLIQTPVQRSTVGPYRVQLAAAYLIRVRAAFSHFIIPIGHKKHMTGYHYDNYMRNQISVARKNSLEWLYCIFTILRSKYPGFKIELRKARCSPLFLTRATFPSAWNRPSKRMKPFSKCFT